MPPIHLNNNPTTFTPPEVVKTMVKWINQNSAAGLKMTQNFRKTIADDCNIKLEGPRGYSIIFTSSCSESNCHIIISTAHAYASKTGKLPHIIISSIEHKSLHSCCIQLSKNKIIQLTIIPVQVYTGTINSIELKNAIRPNTCLISIISASGEIGTINDIKTLGEIAHERNIPFHTDAAQIFGRTSINIPNLNIDALSVSFNNIYGPPGVGLLILRNDFIDGYGIRALICGEGNDELRGGTENIPGIAGSFTAYKYIYSSRESKNHKIRNLRNNFITMISKKILTLHISDYCEAKPRIPDDDVNTPQSSRIPSDPKTKKGIDIDKAITKAYDNNKPVVVIMGEKSQFKTLPNIIMFAILHSEFNIKERKIDNRIFTALDVPPELKNKSYYINLSADNTIEDVKEFIDKLIM